MPLRVKMAGLKINEEQAKRSDDGLGSRHSLLCRARLFVSSPRTMRGGAR